MSGVEKYCRYRAVSKGLLDKIMKHALSTGALRESGKLLGIFLGDTFIFESEEEMNVLMDFALNEYRRVRNSKNFLTLVILVSVKKSAKNAFLEKEGFINLFLQGK